jgi:hypothetical protein
MEGLFIPLGLFLAIVFFLISSPLFAFAPEPNGALKTRFSYRRLNKAATRR